MRDMSFHEKNKMLPVQQPRDIQEGFLGETLWWMCVQQAVGMREVQKRNNGYAQLCSLLLRMQGQEGRIVCQVQLQFRAYFSQATQRRLIDPLSILYPFL